MANLTTYIGVLKILKPTSEFELDKNEVIFLLNKNHPVLINLSEESIGRRIARQFTQFMQNYCDENNMVLEFVATDIIMIEPNR